MKWVVLAVAAASMVVAPFAPASAPSSACAQKCCAESHNCCTDACPCPVSCVLPGSTAAIAPAAARLPILRVVPEHVPPPADEWAAALPERPPVPPPRA